MPFKSISARVEGPNIATASQTLTPPLPTPRANGDLLLAVTSSRSYSGTVATPSGWTPWPSFPKRSATLSGGTVYLFWRVADGSETSPSLVWTGLTAGSAADGTQAATMCLSEMDPVAPSGGTPPAPTDVTVSGAATGPVCGPVTAGLIVSMFTKVLENVSTGTPGANYVERGEFHTASGTGHVLYIQTRDWPSGGNPGAATVTFAPTSSGRSLGIVVAVKARDPVTLNDADKVYLGGQAVDAVYAGTTKVYDGWTPASIAGLTIWLDASQLALADGAPVSPWPNLAAASIPGTMVGTPAPVVRVNALNGLPVVRLTTGQGRLRMTGTGITKDWTVVFVGRVWIASTSARFLAATYLAQPDVNMLLGQYGGTMDTAHDGPAGWFSYYSNPATTDWRMYSGDGGSADYRPRIFKDGVHVGTASSTGGAGWGETLNIAGYSATGTEEAGDVEIAEVVMWNRKLPDGDRVRVEDYLREKWGL